MYTERGKNILQRKNLTVLDEAISEKFKQINFIVVNNLYNREEIGGGAYAASSSVLAPSLDNLVWVHVTTYIGY